MPSIIRTSPASAVQAELLDQIVLAFRKPPNVASILHGDRLIRQGGRGRRTALFPSTKCGGSIPLESQLELAHAITLERTPLVQEYRTQAIRVSLPCGGFYHPDFLIRMTCGAFEVHEVKPSIEHLPLADAQRFNIVRALLIREGVGFRLIDAHSLPSGSVLQEYLIRYSRGHIQTFSKAQIDLAKSLLKCSGNCSFHEAYQVLEQHDLPAQVADFLCFHQQWGRDPENNAPFAQGGA